MKRLNSATSAAREVDVVDPTRRGTGVGRGGVLQRGALGGVRRVVPDGVVVDLEDMAERVLEAEGAAMAQVALDPAMGADPRGRDDGDAPLRAASRRRRRRIADMAWRTIRLGVDGGELHGMSELRKSVPGPGE